jgi:RNA polymerase sigma-70 factor (ECF subfamily)
VVTFRNDLDLYTPRLRRYARGLVAGQPAAAEIADNLVRETLASRGQIGLVARWLDLEVGLYALLTRVHRDAARTGSLSAWHTIETGNFCAGGVTRPERTAGSASPADKISGALHNMALEEREALLLVALEGFSYARSARILKVSRRVLIARLSRARTIFSQYLQASVPMRSGKSRPAHLRVVR